MLGRWSTRHDSRDNEFGQHLGGFPVPHCHRRNGSVLSKRLDLSCRWSFQRWLQHLAHHEQRVDVDCSVPELWLAQCDLLLNDRRLRRGLTHWIDRNHDRCWPELGHPDITHVPYPLGGLLSDQFGLLCRRGGRDDHRHHGRRDVVGLSVLTYHPGDPQYLLLHCVDLFRRRIRGHDPGHNQRHDLEHPTVGYDATSKRYFVFVFHCLLRGWRWGHHPWNNRRRVHVDSARLRDDQCSERDLVPGPQCVLRRR